MSPVRTTFLALFLAALPGVSQQAPPALVDYHFDDEDLASGPDTFLVIQSTKGSVHLSNLYRYSGYRSLEIRSVAGDPDFPELQGYFPLQTHGVLSIQFALLVTNPEEPINIALAGPAHFTEQKNGLAFWLKVEKGVLHQVTDQKPQPLLALRPFTWYLVRCTYRIDEGTYDLDIGDEYQQEPAASVTGQSNVMKQPGSTLDRYSFVSNPFGNNSNALFYVDDIRIAAENGKAPNPFIAPGRRRLFVDRYNDQRKQLADHAVCLPVSDLTDLGMSPQDAHRLHDEGALEWLQQALRTGSAKKIPSGLSADTQRRLDALATWRQGCEAAKQGDPEAARKSFDEAAERAPEARLYEVSAILAAASRQDWREADERWNRTQYQWNNDVRFALISALLGMARKDLNQAELWLRASAESPAPNELIAEQYYYVLLWNGRYTDARTYASQVTQSLKELGRPASGWLERTGDALFFDHDYPRAGQLYEAALRENRKSTSAYLKLSDVWFELGNGEKERFYREGIYGMLK